MNWRNSLLPLVFCLSTFPLILACTDRPAAPLPAAPEAPWFADGADQSGLRFTHFNGMTGKLYYPEIIGSGVAVFDYDNDGDLDVWLVQGSRLDAAGAPLFPEPSPAGGRLFRNDLTINADGTRTMKFTDVTARSGITASAYGMGAATGDFNNDGCVDLYLTNRGANQLWRNNCDGTFTDVSASSGTIVAPVALASGVGRGSRGPGSPSWSVSAAFLDFDRDGWLDLFVGNYLDYRIEANVACFSPSGRPDYCSPAAYRPQPSHLFHNNRNGTFSDVTAAAGMAREFGPALGVATADFNGDGWIDIYVANDGQPNQLWINQRNGTFRNTGLLSGTAMNPHGKPKAGMGVDAGDVDNDGDEDLLVANLRGEGHDLYVNDASGLFEAQSEGSGLTMASQPFTGFGAAWIDVDNDGRLDAFIVHGAVQTLDAQSETEPLPLRQPKLLWRNLGAGHFEDATSRGGEVLQRAEVSRGAAFGDLDNDGDPDVIVNNNGGPARLLINTIGSHRHWVGLRLIGAGGRDMLGARVAIVRSDGATLWRRAHTDGSYASANDPRVIAGLGTSSAPVRVQVTWPDGTTDAWSAVAADRYTTLKEGSGR